jgi:hypothetical protein
MHLHRLFCVEFVYYIDGFQDAKYEAFNIV